MDILSAWVLVVVGLSVIFVYVMAVALKTISKMAARVSDTNERLLVLVAHQTGGHDAAHALISSARTPKKDLPGISTKKEKKLKQPKKEADKQALGYNFTAGVQ